MNRSIRYAKVRPGMAPVKLVLPMSAFDRCFAVLIVLVWMWLTRVAGAAEISSFQAGDGGWHLGTLAVGNLDGDAQPEIVVPYRNLSGQWMLDAFKAGGARLPGFPYAGGGAEINVSPTLSDLDGDGRDEIIFTCGNRVVALRGDGSTLWSTEVNRLNYIPDGGYMTVTNGFYWSNGGGFISNLPATAIFSSQVSSPIVADLNGDGVKEVVTAWKIDPDSTSSFQDFNPFINDVWGIGEWGTVGETWSGGVVFFDAKSGAKKHVYHIHQLVETGLALGQADADQPLEVYVLNDSDSVVCFDKTQPQGFYGNGTLHKQFGKNQRLISGAYEQGVDVHSVDIDGDGLAEVLVPTTQNNPLWQPSETILDDDGAILWRKWKQPVSFPLNQWQNSACMIPVNPDRDNRIDVLSFTHAHEIAFRSWNGVELVDRPGWPKNFYPYLPTPPVVGDVDGDGVEEIVIGTYDPTKSLPDGNLSVFSLDGTLKVSVPVPGGLKHIPSLADANGDGALDVIYRSLAGRVYIQNFGATKAGPVSWATHRGNPSRDGNFGVSLFPPGTPLITRKEGGYRRASFSWRGSVTNLATGWRIYRAEQPSGAFALIATLAADAAFYTDSLPKSGCQYVYEVAAVYDAGEVRSAPFAILSLLNGNLVANGGFEENDNSHWDKWFTGEIHWSNMVASASTAYQGQKSMEITLVNKGNGGSISQFAQYGTPDAYLPVAPGQLYSFGGFFRSGGLSQPSQHWLEWSSTPTGEDPTPRPARPWPLYYTPPFAIGTSATEWIYANRAFVMPSGFSNVELAHRYSIDAPGSGSIYIDNVFFRALPSPGATNWTQVIPFGGSWRYFVDTPPANWFAADFNDSGWPVGLAKFGAGSGPLNTVTPLPPQKPAYYFRSSFVAPFTPCEELLLSATCTEGGAKSLEIYLNGVKLVTTGIDAVTGQGNEVRHYDLAPFLDLIQPGAANTIAVILNNVSQPTWDDVAFDISLKAIISGATATPAPAPAPEPTPTKPRIKPGKRKSSLPQSVPEFDLEIFIPANSVWRVESTDTLFPANWQLVDVVTNNAAGPLLFRDIGQNGRMVPSQTSTRFYRLVAP
ncbi:MAG: VCBS repeat-containing protein [Verrucomicrobia bacterium]|nr:VCBS repeat-containing protein [Verrucomicrobiota bacterium]